MATVAQIVEKVTRQQAVDVVQVVEFGGQPLPDLRLGRHVGVIDRQAGAAEIETLEVGGEQVERHRRSDVAPLSLTTCRYSIGTRRSMRLLFRLIAALGVRMVRP